MHLQQRRTEIFTITVFTISHVLNVDVTNGGAATVTASLLASFFFPWLCLYQDQVTCAQSEGLGGTNMHTITKK